MRPFAVTQPEFEIADIARAVARGQSTLALIQALLEAAFVDVAIAGMPFPLTLPKPVYKLAGVPPAVGVVDPSLALQQAVDHVATVASAIGQAAVWRQK